MGWPSLRARPARPARAAATAAIAVVFLAPLALLVLGSLRPTGTPPPTTVDLLPGGASLSNYADLLRLPAFRSQAANSLLVAAISVPLGALVASWAGFAIARLPRRTAVVLVVVTVIAGTIPATTLFVGRLMLFRIAELTDTPVPLIAPALIGVNPLLVLLFAWSYRTIPRGIYDLASEAGLGPIRTWWHVAMPMRAGAAAVAAAIAFIVSWGNLLDPLLYVYDERWFTLPVGISFLAALPPTDHGVMLAAAVMAVAPVFIVAYLAHRVVAVRR